MSKTGFALLRQADCFMTVFRSKVGHHLRVAPMFKFVQLKVQCQAANFHCCQAMPNAAGPNTARSSMPMTAELVIVAAHSCIPPLPHLLRFGALLSDDSLRIKTK